MHSGANASDYRDYLEALIARQDMGADATQQLFSQIMTGKLTDVQVAGLLIALRAKGETVEEIVGAARAMRSACEEVALGDYSHAVDTCGTGGDGRGTVNVSTMAAIVAAACGQVVIKHGNRAVSSKSGSADVLAALGISVSATAPQLRACLQAANLAFLFAPAYHQATRHASAARKELGVRSIFNLLGPLTNPAGVSRQVVGVFDPSWCAPLAEALAALGSEHVVVVSALDGMDEFSVSGPTRVSEYQTGASVATREVTPQDFGLAAVSDEGLAGGTAKENAAVVAKLLDGTANEAVNSAVLMTASAALYVGGKTDDLFGGIELARAAIASGAARDTVAAWKDASNE